MKKLPLKVAVVTATRAEYGTLSNLMYEIQTSSDMDLQLIVTGTHLSPEFGYTYKVIEKDGFVINEKIEMLLSSDSSIGVAKSLGLCIIGFSEALARLKSDLVILLGDRYETLGVAQAALVHNIPIAHIHGGELTYGALDDSIRHAITKLSHLHYASTDSYRERIIQMGETPGRVINVGSLGLERIEKIKLLTKSELECELGINLSKKTFIVTFHPVTANESENKMTIDALLSSLALLKDSQVIFTKSNADAQGRYINKRIDEYVRHNNKNMFAFNSLGDQRYLSLMKHAVAMIGNSSSGIIEAPYFNLPTINIGSRQNGRIQGSNVINTSASIEEISNAIKHVIRIAENENRNVLNPYYKKDTTLNILHHIRNANIAKLLNKPFYDVKNTELVN